MICKVFSIFWCAVFITKISAIYARTAVKQPAVKPNQQQEITALRNFYVGELIDDRTHKIETNTGKNQVPKLQILTFPGGFPAIKRFLQTAFVQELSKRPVIIHLKDCAAEEQLTNAGRIDGKVHVKLTFNLKTEDGNLVYLTDYQVDTKYSRMITGSLTAEIIMQQSLTAALVYLDKWLAGQADHNPKLAREVKVFFKDYHEKTEGDTIYYAANRPLRWEDFQEKPRNSKFAATVFPSFGFDQQRDVVNGVIRIYLDLKVYVPKSACWVKDYNRDDYTLNHEQRHFDLVEIIGKRFEQKIRSLKLPVDNFDGPINAEFYEFFGQMNRLQDQYDAETQHGINTGQQEKWNKRIDQDLAN